MDNQSLSIVAEFITAGATVFSSLVLAGSLWYVAGQVIEIRRATSAAAHKAIWDLLSSERTLAARRIVFNELHNVHFGHWTQRQIDAAEEVCRTFDAAAQLVQYEFVKENFVADHWAQPLVDGWRILGPYVEDVRYKRQAHEKWDNFKDLAEAAQKYRLYVPPPPYTPRLSWWRRILVWGSRLGLERDKSK